MTDGLVAESPVLQLACRPSRQSLPERDLPPVTEGARSTVREAATFEAITGLPEWETAGDEARARASRAASTAREQALAEGDAAGFEEQERRRNAERRARRAFTCLDWLLRQHTELRPEHVALLPEAWWLAGDRR